MILYDLHNIGSTCENLYQLINGFTHDDDVVISEPKFMDKEDIELIKNVLTNVSQEVDRIKKIADDDLNLLNQKK